MKQLDKLLITSFIGPFFVTFGIALFVLIMQYLWVYIDEIIGKGVGILMLTELIGYLSVSLFPMAFPIAILISSVMVMGNLAEQYELSSFKSAGVSLFRVMRPLAIVAAVLAVVSFLCSNYFIPITNLQFKSRMYDIRKSKPTLSLEGSTFNDDFQGFTIYIGEKLADGKTIKNVLIYDQNTPDGRLRQTSAKRGEMYTTADGEYFVMNLYDGMRMEEMGKRFEDGKRNYSFSRTNFKEYSKVFDLSQFDISDTDKDLFKNNQSMLSVSQLNTAIDSINLKLESRYDKMEKHMIQYFYPIRKRDTIYYNKKPSVKKKKESSKDAINPTTSSKNKQDSLKAKILTSDRERNKEKEKRLKDIEDSKRKKSEDKMRKSRADKIPRQINTASLDELDSIAETFMPADRKKCYSKAKSFARSIFSQASTTTRSMKMEKEKRVKHIYELQTKFSFAAICFIFLFVGAPMGAIVRKGGFGYPLIVALFFFVIFIMTTIMCDKLTETFVLEPVLGAWLPCLSMIPIGMLLTYKAMMDSKMLNLDRITAIFTRFYNYIQS